MDSERNVIKLFGTVHDITERMKADKQLRIAEDDFRSSLDNSPLGICIVSEKGELVYTNKAMLDIHGYDSIDEFRNMPAKDRYTPESYTEHNKREKMRKLGKPVPANYEISIIRKDGKIRHLSVVRNEIVWNGTTHSQLICQDITQRKEAEDMFQSLATNSPVGIYILHDSKFVYTNARFQNNTGYTENELYGMDSMTLVLPEDRDKVRENAIQMLKGKYIPSYEFRLIHKDGSIKWELERVAPIDYHGQKVIIASCQDITERKEMEEQLIVTDRLASIGELVSGVAHEINNPLTGVIGLSDLLLTRNMEADAREDLQMINKEAHRIAQIVKNLLTFARKHPQEKKPLNIKDVINMVLELRAYEQRVHNIKVITVFPDDIPLIMANSFQLMQVFINLITNAEYFMIETKGKGTLTISISWTEDYLRASFVDEGPGIPSNILGKIFNPFFTTKDVGRGTGLGLSICHGIITEHKGRIWAESEGGKGATFRIELPVYREQGQEKTSL
jgi:two-component system NtrC family sensor kinase